MGGKEGKGLRPEANAKVGAYGAALRFCNPQPVTVTPVKLHRYMDTWL